MNKEIYSSSCDSTIFDDKYDEDNRKVIDYEVMSSICKSLKFKQIKSLHKQIIDVADELYRFSDELDLNDKEERNCKFNIIEALKELNKITEYLTKRTLDDVYINFYLKGNV